MLQFTAAAACDSIETAKCPGWSLTCLWWFKTGEECTSKISQWYWKSNHAVQLKKKVNDHDAAKADSELSHALMQANVDSYTKKLNDATAALKRAWLDLDRICSPVDLVNKYILYLCIIISVFRGHLYCNVSHSSFNVVQHTSPQHGVHASSRDHAVFSSCHYQLPDAVCETESLHWHVGHSWNTRSSLED